MDRPWKRSGNASVELRDLAVRLGEQLAEVLAVARVADRYTNEPSDSVVIISADPWRWVFDAADLPQRRTARVTLDRWLELARRVIQTNAPEVLAEFDSKEVSLRGPLDLSENAAGPGSRDHANAAAYVQQALVYQTELLARVLGAAADATHADLWLVPDTNALLKNPALQEWSGEEAATVILVPQVLRELDAHKQHHRNENVRQKAQQLLKQFEEYGRRGDTFVGVPLAGSLRFMEVSKDAFVGESLTWLRSDHADDQLLASALELAWSHPNVSVTLVTEDRGLRNKARQALLTTDSAPSGKFEKESIPAKLVERQRPVIKVKSVRVVMDELPKPPLYQSTAPTSVLVVEIVNAGNRSAFDIHGTATLHDDSGGYQNIGPVDIPVIEVDGTYRCRFPAIHPPWNSHVGPRSVTIAGAYRDIAGAEYSLD